MRTSFARSARWAIGIPVTAAVLVAALFAFSKTHRRLPFASDPKSGQVQNDLPIASDSKRFQEFVSQVYAPAIKPVVTIHSSEMELLLERMRPAAGSSMSGLFHALPLFGREFAFDVSSSGSSVQALDVVLDARLAGRVYPKGQSLCKTRYGVAMPEGNSGLMGTDQSHVQAHRGQALATLARAGVCLHSPLKVPGVPRSTVADLLANAIANFQIEGEVYWEAVALALYLPPARNWINRFGVEFSFDELASVLMKSEQRNSSCAGTHALIALAVVMRVDEQMRILSDDRRDAVHSYFKSTIEMLSREELSGGGWGPRWYVPSQPEPDRSQRQGSVSDEEILIATGHHLEWIALCPPRFVKSNVPMIARACSVLRRILREHGASMEWTDANYCPATHAITSIQTLAKTSTSK